MRNLNGFQLSWDINITRGIRRLFLLIFLNLITTTVTLYLFKRQRTEFASLKSVRKKQKYGSNSRKNNPNN